jgi:5'-methylthioadenosine phosphorylase
MDSARIGVIGGSGLYHMSALTDVREHDLDTPFGRPSDNVLTGLLHGVPVAFLARHGRGHRLIPGEVPYRANVYSLKSLGVRYLISVSAVGSLHEQIRPLDVVLPDQFIDLTKGRAGTFFGNGAVAHVSMAQPVCANLAAVLASSIGGLDLREVALHARGTYLCIEGPAFSTYAESQWYRSMGAHVIGMTNMPEAKLAREAQMAYATLAFVTDYDCWHPREAHVTAESAIENLAKNAAHAQQILSTSIQRLARELPSSEAHTALLSGLVSPPESMSPEAQVRFKALLTS